MMDGSPYRAAGVMAGPSAGSGSTPGRAGSPGFLYNSRVALALVPSLAVLAGFGGTAVAGVLMVGLMGVYILDGMRFKEGAFAAAWLTLALVNVSLVVSRLANDWEQPILLSTLSFGLSGATLFLTGLWATLQFKWIQLQYPAVVQAFEKVLIAGCLPAAGAVLTWGLAAGVGMASAPFFMAPLLCTLYYLLALPLPSSFHLGPRRTSVGGSASKPSFVQDRGDGAVAFLLTTCLPVAVYSVTHLGVLFEGWVHFWSVLLLASGPLLFVSTLKEGLWWLGSSRAVDAVRRLLLLLSLGAFLAAVEGRVVFHSLGQYMRLPPPWNYIAVTVAVYGVASLVLLHVSGALGEEAESFLVGPLLMMSAALGSLAAGLPLWVLPAPLLAAAGMAMFYDTRAFRDYAIFVLGALATAVWFVWHHFWFLDMVFVDGHPLRALCALILLALVPALLVPGLVHCAAPRALCSLLLLAQAAAVVELEVWLYAGDHEALTLNMHPMYPAFLVAATSALGLLMARRAGRGGVVGEGTAYMLQCAYAAKLAMLVLPGAKLTLPVLGVLLAVSPPLLLQREDLARRRRLPPWQGLGLAAAVVLAVAAARFAVFDVLKFLLDRRPSEALLAGALLLCMAAGCVPLLARYYPGAAAPRRAALLAATLGVLLVLLRPPLPLAGGAACPRLPFGLCPRLWDEGHVPQHEEDDAAIYGDGLRRREHWPLWLMLGAVLAGVGALTTPAATRHTVALRLAQAALSAGLVGGYLAGEFFSGLWLLQCLVVGSALLAALFLVLMQQGLPGGVVLMPLLGTLWVGGFPAALALAASATLPPLPADAGRLHPDGYKSVEQERVEAVRSAVLAVWAAEAVLLAFALKLRVPGHRGPVPAASLGSVGGYRARGSGSYLEQASKFLGQCMPAAVMEPGGSRALGKASAASLHRLRGEGLGWVPTACNLAALFAFALLLALNFEFTGGAAIGTVVLAPVLLLLTQDPVLLPGLGDQQRYFPPVAAAVAYLAYSASVQLVEAAAEGGGEGWSALGTYPLWSIVTSGAGLALCLPTHIDFLAFLWSRGRRGGARLIVPAALCVLPLVISSSDAVHLLALGGIVGAVIQAATAQQERLTGRKII